MEKIKPVKFSEVFYTVDSKAYRIDVGFNISYRDNEGDIINISFLVCGHLIVQDEDGLFTERTAFGERVLSSRLSEKKIKGLELLGFVSKYVPL